ncbi:MULTISPECIES: rhodanese-like domain-containing protein [Deinococcus]|uniref:Rhodanese-like domain-containing protein n=1 Tax=Deinococcus cavernae TaxID=2320857 RepID=A0A418V713_9DEIO|nr:MULTISPECIES: rhodanese-like domain-containing protein [Deinococcus]RJF71894.1 rhodanese-like domain-containing protein [Deinococcus cavernae]
MFGFLKKLLGLPDGVSPQDAQAMVKTGSALILDVRTSAERQAAHIPGSLHLSLDELGRNAGKLPKDKTIICQCASGMRSAAAAKQLAAQGFTTLNLKGGLGGWQRAGLPTK